MTDGLAGRTDDILDHFTGLVIDVVRRATIGAAVVVDGHWEEEVKVVSRK
jgi:hypothetical protein